MTVMDGQNRTTRPSTMKATPAPMKRPRERLSSRSPMPVVAVMAPSAIAKAATRNAANITLVLGATSAVDPQREREDAADQLNPPVAGERRDHCFHLSVEWPGKSVL